MKRILLLSSLAFIMAQCTTVEPGDVEGTAPEMSDRLDLQKHLDAFIGCKDNSKEKFACKGFPGQAINEYYGIEDFNHPDVEGDYLPSDEIRLFLGGAAWWTELGDATEQKVLDQAQEFANKGVAVVAVSDKQGGNVALILPGEQQISGDWGDLNCPNSASYIMKPHKLSYVGKKLSYAWKKPKKVKIFARIEN